MKKIFLFLIFSLPFIACSDDKDDTGIRYDEVNGYLTNLESAKNGIVGVWGTVSGSYYYSYDADGSKCDGFSPNGNWDICGKYDLLKSGSSYILRIYVVNSSSSSYVDRVITTLNKKELSARAEDGTELAKLIRVK